MTKSQLIELIHELAWQHPEMARTLSDRRQLISGNTKTLVTRLRKEIRDAGDEPGWQNYWRNKGFTLDYSGIRTKLETLLMAGHADEVLTLGRELVKFGTRQVEESHDEGETAMEIAACMPVIVEALDQSSLDAADKLNWALDAVLEDQFDVCEAFAEYLHRKHPKPAWHMFADRVLTLLDGLKGTREPILSASATNATSSATGPSIPLSSPAEKKRFFRFVKAKPSRQAAMIAWSAG